MSRVYADFVLPEDSGVSQDLTLGTTSDTVVVTAGASLNVNTVKDSGGNTLWTSDGSGNLSSMNSAFQGSGKPVLLATNTFTDATTSDFTSQISATYKLYIFKFIDVHADNDNVQFRAGAYDSNAIWATIKMASFFTSEGPESGSGSVGYNTSYDSYNTDLDWPIAYGLGNATAETVGGEFRLFQPMSTTFYTYFTSIVSGNSHNDRSQTSYVAGYVLSGSHNVTGIRFGMSGGTMDGIIKMYGFA